MPPKKVAEILKPGAPRLAVFETWDAADVFNFQGPTSIFSSQTSGPFITDIHPAVRDNGDLIGVARGVPVNQDGPRSCPKPIFSAL
jgi:hypothetical protein